MSTNDPLGRHHTADNLLPGRVRRFAPLVAAIAGAIALVGYLSGIKEPAAPVRAPALAKRVKESVPPAARYSELSTAKLQPNANWEQKLSQLKFDSPGIFDPVIRTDDMKLAALADRARNRAFDGAPPSIPHPVESRSAAACLACHNEGIKVGDRVASRISHAHFTNCTQCHVEHASPGDPVATDFVGVYRAGPGPRANPGAPPGIPHQTFMRENCAACHGLITRAGTRTTHPWLTNCIQCHAPSATLDQANFAGAAP